ncbi:MAG TPA: hypothetical protein VHE32_12400 [Rhodanobacteraceae bacterium]|nr:hypothetical protein [Rhodanobacteraceae bacterium]
MNYSLHPEAVLEHEEQANWYDARVPGLGDRYNTSLMSVVSRICESPRSFRMGPTPGIRAAMLRDFPFNVMFRETNGEIQILAVAAHRKRPGYWLSRLQKSPGSR